MTTLTLPGAASQPQPLVSGFATAAGVLVAFVFLSYWPTYNHVVLGGRSTLFYYALPGFLALPLVFLRPIAAARLLNEPVVWWFTVYVVTGMAWLLLAQDFPNIAGQQWRLRILAFFFFLTMMLILTLARPRTVALAIVACIALGAALNWYDFLNPSVLVPVGIPGANPGRGAGFFINANGAAAFIAMATIVVLPFMPMRWRAALLVAAVVGVAPTFSRFGWIIAPFTIVAAAWLKLLDRRQIAVIAVALPLLLAAAGLYYEYTLERGDANALERLDWFQSLGGHADFSVRERAYVAQQAWERFLESPLFGQGIGVTLSKGARVGTHNMYVLLMAEQGLFGLALYLSFVAIIGLRGRRLARLGTNPESRDIGRAMMLYAFFVIAYGFVSHNVLEDAHGMFILAFIVSSAAVAHAGERQSAGELA